jgi:hypothetical protein
MTEQENVDLSSLFVLLFSEEQLTVGERSCSSPKRLDYWCCRVFSGLPEQAQ